MIVNALPDDFGPGMLLVAWDWTEAGKDQFFDSLHNLVLTLTLLLYVTCTVSVAASYCYCRWRAFPERVLIFSRPGGTGTKR